MTDGDGGTAAGGIYPIELQRRIALLRREHPAAEIDVDLVRSDGGVVVVKASIRVPGAGSVSSLGVVAGDVLEQAIEQAERRAIERALSIARTSIAVEETPSAAPTPITNRQPQPAERRPPAPIRTNAPIDIGSGRTASPAPARSPAPTAAVEGDVVLADFSWTAFWNWARENGLSKQADIEAIIGQSYEELTPAQVRKLIMDKQGN